MQVELEIDGYEFNELESVAQKVADVLPKDCVLAIHGEMGVGKTTLVVKLCELLGVDDEVSSPTFGLINVYKAGEEEINHIDLYRVKNAEEAEAAGVYELFNSGNLTLVEWPERIADELPEDIWLLKIDLCEKFNHDGRRKLILHRPL